MNGSLIRMLEYLSCNSWYLSNKTSIAGGFASRVMEVACISDVRHIYLTISPLNLTDSLLTAHSFLPNLLAVFPLWLTLHADPPPRRLARTILPCCSSPGVLFSSLVSRLSLDCLIPYSCFAGSLGSVRRDSIPRRFCGTLTWKS